jgi:hypothetical protein
MDAIRLLAMAGQVAVAAAIMWGTTRLYLRRQRGTNAGLRSEIAAQVRFETTLDRARIRNKGLGGGGWLTLRRPQRLIVGSDAFIFSAPNALKEYVFRASECSIEFSQEPSSLFDRSDWIIITGTPIGRRSQTRLAISQGSLMDVWQALTQAGARWAHPGR